MASSIPIKFFFFNYKCNQCGLNVHSFSLSISIITEQIVHDNDYPLVSLSTYTAHIAITCTAYTVNIINFLAFIVPLICAFLF